MKNLFCISAILVTFCITFSCAPSKLYISKTLPVEIQQHIDTGISTEIAFEFIGHPQGNEVYAEFNKTNDAIYPVNKPLEGMIIELLRTKYGHISNTAVNKVKVEITDLNSAKESDVYSLMLGVNVFVDKNGEVDRQRFAYDMGLTVQYGFDGAGAEFKKEVRSNVEELLLKFIISIDKYLDSLEL